MVTKEELIDKISSLGKSIDGFSAVDVATTFINNSGLYSENLSLGQCISRCIDWHANEQGQIDALKGDLATLQTAVNQNKSDIIAKISKDKKKK